MAGYYPPEPFDDGPDELDDLRADFAELEDQVLGLEHDLELIAEVHRALGLGTWGRTVSVDVYWGVEVSEDQAAVLDRLSML